MMAVPLKYILTLALVSAATGAPTSIARPAASNVTVARMMPNTNFPAGDLPGKDHEFPPGTKPEACQALCDKTPECHAWTFLKRGGPGGQGMSCCIKGPIISDGCPLPAPGMVSGAKVAGSAQCTHDPPPTPLPASGDHTYCACASGWNGADCSHATGCDSNPCKNAATCTASGGDHTCACKAAWTGEDCGETGPCCKTLNVTGEPHRHLTGSFHLTC